MLTVEGMRPVASRNKDLGRACRLGRAHQQVEIVELAQCDVTPGLEREHRSLERNRADTLRVEQAREAREFAREVQVVERVAIEFRAHRSERRGRNAVGGLEPAINQRQYAMRSRRERHPIPIDAIESQTGLAGEAADAAVIQAVRKGCGIAPQAAKNQTLLGTQTCADDAVADVHDVFETTRTPVLLQRQVIAPRGPRSQRRAPPGAPRNRWE